MREERGIQTQSPINLVLTDGRSLVATATSSTTAGIRTTGVLRRRARARLHDPLYTAGSGYGKADGEWRMGTNGATTSVLVASEPLSQDTSTWMRAPEYTMLVAEPDRHGVIDVSLQE